MYISFIFPIWCFEVFEVKTSPHFLFGVDPKDCSKKKKKNNVSTPFPYFKRSYFNGWLGGGVRVAVESVKGISIPMTPVSSVFCWTVLVFGVCHLRLLCGYQKNEKLQGAAAGLRLQISQFSASERQNKKSGDMNKHWCRQRWIKNVTFYMVWCTISHYVRVILKIIYI